MPNRNSNRKSRPSRPRGQERQGRRSQSEQSSGQSPVAREARRNVRLAFAPQRQAINQAQLSAQQNYLGSLQGVRSAYGGFQRELGRLPEFDTSKLSARLMEQITGLGEGIAGAAPGLESQVSGLPVGLPASEAAAGQALGTTLGAGSLEALSGLEARQQAYTRSAGREGALAERYARDNLTQDLLDVLQGYDLQRTQVAGQMPGYIRQEMDRLREQAAAEESEAAFAQLVQDLIGNTLSRGGGRPGGGRPGRRGPRGPRDDDRALIRAGLSGLRRPPEYDQGRGRGRHDSIEDLIGYALAEAAAQTGIPGGVSGLRRPEDEPPSLYQPGGQPQPGLYYNPQLPEPSLYYDPYDPYYGLYSP